MTNRTKQADDERAALSEMAVLTTRNLDVKRETVHRRLRRKLTEGEVGWAVTRLLQKDLICVVEKRGEGEVIYALTDEGWALSGHEKPFWLEVVA